MPDDQPALIRLMREIAAGEASAVLELLAAQPDLATARLVRTTAGDASNEFFLDEITHHVYAGDTALHVAAASYGITVAQSLMLAGANVGATNRRGAQPLHYAADGMPGSAHWNPTAQAATIALLVAAGADPDATDVGGVTPLHRAVRTRCAAAVGALLDAGADPERRNSNGSTAADLATRATGRGGSGSAEARSEQLHIAELLGSADDR